MKFDPALETGTVVKRYKRFLADIRLADGSVVTAHCPNSGSMKSCWAEGWRALLSVSDNPRRKLRFTWEMVHNGQCWIGINTQIPNVIAAEAITAGRIPELTGYAELRREVKYGQNSRVDIVARNGETECYIEVKNVTLVDDEGYYAFPDAVTERGRKHLRELMKVVRNGHRGVMLFVIQRSDGTGFRAARDIDPEYAKALRKAHRAGVEILAYLARVTPSMVELTSQSVDFQG